MGKGRRSKLYFFRVFSIFFVLIFFYRAAARNSYLCRAYEYANLRNLAISIFYAHTLNCIRRARHFSREKSSDRKIIFSTYLFYVQNAYLFVYKIFIM